MKSSTRRARAVLGSASWVLAICLSGCGEDSSADGVAAATARSGDAGPSIPSAMSPSGSDSASGGGGEGPDPTDPMSTPGEPEPEGSGGDSPIPPASSSPASSQPDGPEVPSPGPDFEPEVPISEPEAVPDAGETPTDPIDSDSTGTGGSGGANSGSGGEDTGTGDAGTPGIDSGSPATGDCNAPGNYDERILCDGPVAYWALNQTSGTEPDLTGNGLDATHEGSDAEVSELPNGDSAVDLDGESQYVSVPSHPSLSIPTTGMLTWEAWIQPAVLEFPNQSNGYVDWMGKCADYSPTCEWEARMYGSESDRCNRLSAYAFNPEAGLGSGAYFQTECGTFSEREWIHVVGQYTLFDQPSGCDDTDDYPGSIEIWVNGINWNQSSHGQTGCMSQYQVSPEANDSPLNIGTMAGDAWFQGAIGKVAIYDYLLDGEQIAAHFAAMTGRQPTGSCDGECSF